MVDKLDVRIPADAQLTPEFGKVYADTRGDPKYWHSSPYYGSTADLRPFGHEMILHMGLHHQKQGEKGHSHKVELIDTGMSTYSEWLAEIERVFEIPIAYRKSSTSRLQPQGVQQLEVMRIDLAADVPDIPVDWFRTHMRVLWKRRRAEIGEYMILSQGEGETLYFGKRPNCFRVYNKIAERKEQHKRLTRRTSPDAEILTFEEACHTSPDAILTRVERQIAGGKVPANIRTLSQLVNLPHFDPFVPVEILPRASLPSEQITTNCILTLAGKEVQRLVNEHGLHRARQLIRYMDPANASRNLKRLELFFEVKSPQTGVSREQLLAFYRKSVKAQLVA
jgi:hypothetical protein